MIRVPTVFVIGAGASRELNFPIGSDLLKQISQTLDIRFNYNEMESGDTRVLAAFEELSKTSDGRRGDVNPYLHAGWLIRDAAQLGLSIDNVINQIDQNLLVPICGKIAIARQLLLAEKSSVIAVDRDNPSNFPLSSIRETWLGRFAQIVSQDVRTSELKKIFENVSIISFNYDRSIRRSLPAALMSQFAIDEIEAQSLTKMLRIFHPYGSLGPLPWEVSYPDGVGYGDANVSSLTTVAQSLRTFTEQIEDSSELAEMRDALSKAERIIFLGFGYHRQNMELLSSGVVGNAKRVYGTSLGLSESDNEVVKQELTMLFHEHYRGHFGAILHRKKCVEFMDEHFRTFVS